MPLRALADLGEAVAEAPDTLVTGISLDSRTVLPGDLYAALPGFNVHGARFARGAVRRGAVAILTDEAGAAALREGEAPPVPVLVVPRPRNVLGTVAATVYGHPASDLTMLGITGTNGKTTTAYLIESALRALGWSTGLIGTVETRIGDERIDSVHTTPEATDLHAILGVMRDRGIDTCVMEVSSHALDQHRVDGVVYDLALFTNLSQDHLDYHATMEDYFAAKAELFTPERSRAGVVCVDDDWGRRLAAQAAIPVTTLATSGTDADWHVEVEPDGPPGAFRLSRVGRGPTLSGLSHLPGTFNVTNTALAALALLQLDIEPHLVESALSVAPDVPGRMEVVAAGGPDGPQCIVDFAHTPDAVDAALRALRPSTEGRLIAVLGAGGDRDRGKRAAMGAAAARWADVVVVTDDNPRSEDPASIRQALLAGASDAMASGSAAAVEVIDGGARAPAISEAIAIAVLDASRSSARDTVVVLGKGHEKGQEILGVKHPFDDREALRSALAAAGVGVAR